MKNRAGQNILVPKLAYKAFLPTPLQNVELILDNELTKKVSEANRYLGILDGATKQIPNVDLFISAYVRKEALMSSQIEGTQCSLDDILDPDVELSANADVIDVVNYTKAINFAITRMNKLPICGSLLKEIHSVLLQNSRGSEKNPGEFRKSQNWIGHAGCNLMNAKFVPPTPTDMMQSISDLEKYINNEESMYDCLIDTALIHYQFETIHPFLDGNGRIGRMLIVLYLMQKKIITYPVFYVSYFLKKNRIEYYDRLAEVRSKGNYEQWINFFLEAVIETCKDSLQTIEEITLLNNSNLQKLKGNTKNTMLLFDYLLNNPIIEINKTAKELNLSYNTVAKCVKKLIDLNILIENTNNKRNRVYAYEKYLNILKKNTENL